MLNDNLYKIISSIIKKEYSNYEIKKYKLNDIENLKEKLKAGEIDEVVFFENSSNVKLNEKRIAKFFDIFKDLNFVFTNDISKLIFDYFKNNNYEITLVTNLKYEDFNIYIYKTRKLNE